MFGKRTIKNLLTLWSKRLITFAASYSIPLFTIVSNFFFFIFFLLEKIRKRDSSRITANYDQENTSLYVHDHSTNEKLYFIIPSRILSFKKGLRSKYNQLFKYYHLGIIPFQPQDNVLDIGANVGEVKKSLDRLEVDINYIGVEPSPSEFKVLKLNCPDSELFNIGCWNNNDIIDFFVSSESADSSFIHPPSHVEKVEKIEVKRIDSFISKEIKLLKIDAEGGEYEVIQGCEGILNLISYISVDVGFERGKESQSTFVEVNQFLQRNNFELIAIEKTRLITLYKNKSL